MKRYPNQWAAHRRDERLEIGKTKHGLYHKYLDHGLSLDELVVLGIRPPMEDELDYSGLSHCRGPTSQDRMSEVATIFSQTSLFRAANDGRHPESWRSGQTNPDHLLGKHHPHRSTRA
jgi:hypothetical protein